MHIEYKEVKVPQAIMDRLNELAATGDPDKPATLTNGGFIDWANEQSKEEGWRVVWRLLNLPFVLLEREVD